MGHGSQPPATKKTMRPIALLVPFLASCHGGLLGAGTGGGSCAAPPFRSSSVQWPLGCPDTAPCCSEFGYCQIEANWHAGLFRDCNGVSNGRPLEAAAIAAENQAIANGDSRAANLLVVPAGSTTGAAGTAPAAGVGGGYTLSGATGASLGFGAGVAGFGGTGGVGPGGVGVGAGGSGAVFGGSGSGAGGAAGTYGGAGIGAGVGGAGGAGFGAGGAGAGGSGAVFGGSGAGGAGSGAGGAAGTYGGAEIGAGGAAAGAGIGGGFAGGAGTIFAVGGGLGSGASFAGAGSGYGAGAGFGAAGFAGGLVAFPNGAIVPVEQPAVAAARAEHLAAVAASQS